MDTGRDLGRSELWRESLERSLARRTKPRPEPISGASSRLGRDLDQDGSARARSQRSARAQPSPAAQRSARARRAARIRRRRRRLLLGVTGIATVAVLAATLPGAFGGGARDLAPAALYTHPLGGRMIYLHLDPTRPGIGLGANVVSRRPRTCPLLAQPDGYVNPLARAHVTPERIDQGVDYAGSGTLAAIGTARITRVGRSGTGWPGDFIEYRLLNGADSGCYVYYAEGLLPVNGLRVGQTVQAGQAIARIIRYYPTGIELGWAAGVNTTSYAAKSGKWTPTDDADNVPTAAGESFSALIAAVGGPPGKKEGAAPSGDP